MNEVWKLNAERMAKIEAEMHHNAESMDIYSPVGVRIVFMGRNGYEQQIVNAKQALAVGGTYTVACIIVENWSSSVELLEMPGRFFNTVMFRNSND
jgi:hypothetical protein